jgi:peptide/nickel transport system permease protein
MGHYIVKRTLLLIPAVLIVCVIVFILMRMVPGDAIDVVVNKMAAQGQTVDTAKVEAMLGLDKPAPVQFFSWIKDVLRGDLGNSYFQYVPVSELLALKLPATIQLGIMSLLFSLLISIPAGLYCAARQDSVFDYGIRGFSTILVSLPIFWVATLVLIYPGLWWGYSPPMTYVSIFDDFSTNMKMFLIPALLSAIGQAGMQIRMVRTMTLEVLRQDYVRTAWSKGVGERRVLFIHAFRNALIPVITMIGGNIAMLLGGNVIIENIFNIPGVGSLLISALNTRDYPIVQGCVLILAMFVMFINLLVDICYKWIDPRVTLE